MVFVLVFANWFAAVHTIRLMPFEHWQNGLKWRAKSQLTQEQSASEQQSDPLPQIQFVTVDHGSLRSAFIAGGQWPILRLVLTEDQVVTLELDWLHSFFAV